MTRDDAHEYGSHRDAAVGALADREYERAGDRYTRAAWTDLAGGAADRDPFEPEERGTVGVGLGFLAAGIVAYRVAARDRRAKRRTVEGVAVARDLRDAVFGDPVQRACLTEFVGDLRAAAGLEATGAYESAAGAYEAAAPEAPVEWATTPLFEAANRTVQQVSRGLSNGEIAVAWDDLHGPDPEDGGAYLAHRARYKTRRFPGLVERAVDAGHLAAPRGSTEYGNGSYRCPACDSNDVNWVGDDILCLRCSTRLARQ
ncbi:MAG: hypothetical protein V5A62_17975 [Haloarculaceae archaeon]